MRWKGFIDLFASTQDLRRYKNVLEFVKGIPYELMGTPADINQRVSHPFQNRML